LAVVVLVGVMKQQPPLNLVAAQALPAAVAAAVFSQHHLMGLLAVLAV
jgi:hypothetical protein